MYGVLLLMGHLVGTFFPLILVEDGSSFLEPMHSEFLSKHILDCSYKTEYHFMKGIILLKLLIMTIIDSFLFNLTKL